MLSNTADIGILGAGIMGCCLALELSQRGYKVQIVDLAASPMTSTSLHNEGKLHLGFVYANDPLKKTYGIMIRGSLSFTHILRKLTGQEAHRLGYSRPFHYFVPADSQMDFDSIYEHFNEVENEIKRVEKGSGHFYFDRKVDSYFEQNPPKEHQKLFSAGRTIGSFRTEERSVSPAAVAEILCRAIDDDPNIDFIGNTFVISAQKLKSGSVEIELCIKKNNTSKKIFPCVANCLWDDKLRIDETAGIPATGPWFLRYKATINVDLHPSLKNQSIPSATGILGPYGDIVNHGDNSYYLSWYPLCKLAQSKDEDGRKLHDLVHNEPLASFVKLVKSTHPSIARSLSSFAHKRFVRRNFQAMSAYIPSLAGIPVNRLKCSIGGGVILARGATDIDDSTSYLHQRSKIGPVAYGSYVTIDTGKYCTAPLLAVESADLISDIL